MSRFFIKAVNRYFKFYLILSLLGFTILVLLMNIPRVWAGELNSSSLSISQKANSATKFPQEQLQIPAKLYRWELPVSQKPNDPDCYMEMHGNHMMFKMLF